MAIVLLVSIEIGVRSVRTINIGVGWLTTIVISDCSASSDKKLRVSCYIFISPGLRPLGVCAWDSF